MRCSWKYEWNNRGMRELCMRRLARREVKSPSPY
nr:MAG TPA: hypothetical protein [Caudoviricetes sp.]